MASNVFPKINFLLLILTLLIVSPYLIIDCLQPWRLAVRQDAHKLARIGYMKVTDQTLLPLYLLLGVSLYMTATAP